MITTKIEKMLIDELVKNKIPHYPQKPVGYVSGYCRSKYPCKCGMDWCDEYGDYREGYSDQIPEDCSWWKDGYSQYYIDIYIPIKNGLAVEIDDKEFHSKEEQIKVDMTREQDIKKMLNCEFMRFTAKKVYNETSKCIEEIKEWINKNA